MMWNALVLGEDLRTRGGGRCAGDNQHTVYRGAGWSPQEEAELNARIARQTGDAMAIRYWTFHYEPSGALAIPLVSIRGPLWQAPSQYWAYADRLSRTGSTDLYSEWAMPTHEPEDLGQNMGTALRALVAWIETGARPTWPTTP
jgi:hypothetical protein